MTGPELIDGILAVLARWYPDTTLVVTPASGGASTPVFRVEADGEIGYLRLGEHPGDLRVGEIATHRDLSTFNLPVPQILEYEYAPPELDRAIALTSMVPGVPLAGFPDGEGFEEIGRQAGRVLASINRVPVAGYGWVTGVTDTGMLQATHRSREVWAADYLDAAETVARSGTFSRDINSRLGSSIERWARLPGERPASLAHGDFDSTHIYLDPGSGKFTGIIDFGEIRGADPLYDLGHLLLHDGESGRPAIFAHVLSGFTRAMPQPDDTMDRIHLQALAIGARALAIQLGRLPSRYRDWLERRMDSLLREMKEIS